MKDIGPSLRDLAESTSINCGHPVEEGSLGQKVNYTLTINN